MRIFALTVTAALTVLAWGTFELYLSVEPIVDKIPGLAL